MGARTIKRYTSLSVIDYRCRVGPDDKPFVEMQQPGTRAAIHNQRGRAMMTISNDPKIDEWNLALRAPGRAPDIPASADVYGWLIGSWELDVYHYVVDVQARRMKAEVHFQWVLEGRAVQDVWIMPRRSDRTADADKGLNMYGTTLRVWDPTIQAWRVTWINPVTGGRNELTGRRSGKDIVQIGTHADGTPIRWSFTEITPDSFRWIGEALAADGETWTLEGEFRARRIPV